MGLNHLFLFVIFSAVGLLTIEVLQVSCVETNEVTVALSLDEPIPFDETAVDKFFTMVKSQLVCGYPMFGIPSLVPLKLSYKFKTSFDLLQLKKVSIGAANITIWGLNNFTWNPEATSFTRTKTNISLTFPNITATAATSLNGANGTSFLELYNVTLGLTGVYEEHDNLLYVTDLIGSIALERSKIKIAYLFPKSSKLSKIWNKAIGRSLPILVELFNESKLKIEYISRLLNGAKFYAINTINNALNTYNLNFDSLVESLKKFAEGSNDSLMCDGMAEDYGWLRTAY